MAKTNAQLLRELQAELEVVRARVKALELLEGDIKQHAAHETERDVRSTRVTRLTARLTGAGVPPGDWAGGTTP